MNDRTRLLEFYLQGRSVAHGQLPLPAARMLAEMWAAMEDTGLRDEPWEDVHPHIEFMEAGSFAGALTVEAPLAQQLKPTTERFVAKVAKREVTPAFRRLVMEYFKPNARWTMAISSPGRPEPVIIDRVYRDALEQSRAHDITGTTELYARIVGIGGQRRYWAEVSINGQPMRRIRVATRDLAKKLAKRMFEEVKLQADVSWDGESLELTTVSVTELDESWSYRPLHKLYEEYGPELFQPGISLDEWAEDRHGEDIE